MIGDCVKDETDIIVLVSGDSDLVPPIEFIQANFPSKKVKVYFPPTIYCYDLKDNIAKHKSKVIRLEANKIKFQNSIMPEAVSDGNNTYTIPDKWK